MAETFECPSCALEVEGRPEVCPYCGYEYPERKKGIGTVAWLMVAALVIPLVWLLMEIL